MLLTLFRILHGADCGFTIRQERVVRTSGKVLGTVTADVDAVCRIHGVASGTLFVIRSGKRCRVVTYGGCSRARQALLNVVNL